MLKIVTYSYLGMKLSLLRISYRCIMQKWLSSPKANKCFNCQITILNCTQLFEVVHDCTDIKKAFNNYLIKSVNRQRSF